MHCPESRHQGIVVNDAKSGTYTRIFCDREHFRGLLVSKTIGVGQIVCFALRAFRVIGVSAPVEAGPADRQENAKTRLTAAD
jgi:hypothetical protein